MKTPTFGLKVFVLVVVELGVVLGWVLKNIVGWCWFGLVLRNVCKREMLGFQRKYSQTFVNTSVLVLAIG